MQKEEINYKEKFGLTTKMIIVRIALFSLVEGIWMLKTMLQNLTSAKKLHCSV
jgi:hypothetical protein